MPICLADSSCKQSFLHLDALSEHVQLLHASEIYTNEEGTLMMCVSVPAETADTDAPTLSTPPLPPFSPTLTSENSSATAPCTPVLSPISTTSTDSAPNDTGSDLPQSVELLSPRQGHKRQGSRPSAPPSSLHNPFDSIYWTRNPIGSPRQDQPTVNTWDLPAQAAGLDPSPPCRHHLYNHMPDHASYQS